MIQSKEMKYVQNEIPYLEFNKLLDFKEVKHAFSASTKFSFRTDLRRKNNKISLEEYQDSLNNYAILGKELGFQVKDIVKVNQEHTDNIVIVDEKINKNTPDINLDKYLNCDGLITNLKGVVLATVSADCIIFLMYDPIKKVIANIHSGWRGTLKGISVKAVNMMVEHYGSKVQDIMIFVSPSICRKCFKVQDDVKNLFLEKYGFLDNIKDIIKSNTIDTVLLNKTLLLRNGINLENIVISNICTKCNKNYLHSYRASIGAGGLNTAIIELI